MTEITEQQFNKYFSDISKDNVITTNMIKQLDNTIDYIVEFNKDGKRCKHTVKTQLTKKLTKKGRIEERKNNWVKFGIVDEKFKPRVCDEMKIEITNRNKKIQVKETQNTQPNLTIFKQECFKKELPKKEKKLAAYQAPSRGNSKAKEKYETFKKLYDSKRDNNDFYNKLIDRELNKMRYMDFLEEYDLLHTISEEEYQLYKLLKHNRSQAIKCMKNINEENKKEVLEEVKKEFGYKEEVKKNTSNVYVPPSKKKSYTSDRNRNQIKISNFVKGTTKEELFELCSQFGKTNSVFIPISKRGRNKGEPLDFAFVAMQTSKDVENCIKNLNRSQFNSMIISVEKNIRK